MDRLEPPTCPDPVLDSKKDEYRATLSSIGESTGAENTNLYVRGVNEGRSGELLEASELLEGRDLDGPWPSRTAAVDRVPRRPGLRAPKQGKAKAGTLYDPSLPTLAV